MGHICNLSGNLIPHASDAILTFIIPSKYVKAPTTDFLTLENGTIVKVGETFDSSQYSSFSEYTSTRICFDIKNLSDEFHFYETPTNIKNLFNLIKLIPSYYTSLTNTCVVTEKETVGYKEKFSPEYLMEMYEDKEYHECFSYIINNIDYVYVMNGENPIKLHYNLISYETYAFVTSSEFTKNYYGFYYNSKDDIIKNIDLEYGYDEEIFNEEKVLTLFENVINPFYYNMYIDSDEDFINVLEGYIKASYIELLFRDTYIKLTPTIIHENIYNSSNQLILDIMLGETYVSDGENNENIL